MKKIEFFTYLKNELVQYKLTPDTDSEVKREKKQYINGLMRASRFFGISFEELRDIIDSEFIENIDKSEYSGREELLDIPTFIRQNKRISITDY